MSIGLASKSCDGTSGIVCPASGKTKFHRPELDILRFFAFLTVFMTHALRFPTAHLPLWVAELLQSITSAGSFGVDLFFVLSAYLITELLIREKEQLGTLDVKSFYVRRILRIWPLYYFFIALVFAVPFLNPGHEFSFRYVLLFLLLLGNWSIIAFGGLGGAIFPLWSIAIEEQFYVFWPPLVARFSRKQIVIAALGMFLAATATRVVTLLLHAKAWQIWVNTFCRLDPIAAGILLAVLLKGRIPSLPGKLRFTLFACGVSLITVTRHFVGTGDEKPLWTGTLIGFPLVAISCCAILISFLGVNVQVKALEYLGKISYGLYVYHMMCVMITDRLFQQTALGRVSHFGWFLREAIALTLTIFVAAISYNMFESPFLKLKNKFTHVQSRPV